MRISKLISLNAENLLPNLDLYSEGMLPKLFSPILGIWALVRGKRIPNNKVPSVCALENDP